MYFPDKFNKADGNLNKVIGKCECANKNPSEPIESQKQDNI